MIKILLAEDHALVRQGLKAILEGLQNMKVVGEATDGTEVIELAAKTSPDIVLMDISMPGLHGIEATKILKKEKPTVKVLILSVHEDETYIQEAYKAGASGFLIKKLAVNDLKDAIEHILQYPKDFFLPEQLLVSHHIQNPIEWLNQKSLHDTLTSREKEVLSLLVKGLNSRQIAEQLFVSTKTIESHRAHLFTKMRCNSIAEMVTIARQKGLIK